MFDSSFEWIPEPDRPKYQFLIKYFIGALNCNATVVEALCYTLPFTVTPNSAMHFLDLQSITFLASYYQSPIRPGPSLGFEDGTVFFFISTDHYRSKLKIVFLRGRSVQNGRFVVSCTASGELSFNSIFVHTFPQLAHLLKTNLVNQIDSYCKSMQTTLVHKIGK